MRRQTYGYLPSRKASPSIGWYQIILFGDRGTCVLTCPGLLHSTAGRLGFKPVTYWSEVRHHTATPLSHASLCGNGKIYTKKIPVSTSRSGSSIPSLHKNYIEVKRSLTAETSLSDIRQRHASLIRLSTSDVYRLRCSAWRMTAAVSPWQHIIIISTFNNFLSFSLYICLEIIRTNTTRSSADADNALDAFVGQSRSTNISGPFQVK